MRYCSRCGEISNGGRCHKCGGRPVVSIATGLVTETGTVTASVADRWQSRYGSILNQDGAGMEAFDPRKSVSTGIPTRRNITKDPIFQRPNDSIRASNTTAAESFHSKLASLTRDKGGEIGSYRRLSMLDTPPSGSPALDSIAGSPTHQQRKPIRPRIDSHLFHYYQKSLQEHPSPASTAASSPASAQPAFSFDQPLSPVSTPDTVISHILPTTSEDMVKPTESPSSKVIGDTASSKNQSCHKCERPLKGGGPRIRLPAGNDGQGYIWYHYNCLRCPACNSHFTEKQFVRVGQEVYHPKCHRAMSPPLSRSTESSACTPKTPAPRIACDACHEQIKAAKCINHKSRLFHPECFKCVKCKRVLSSDQPYYDILDEPHCTSCTHVLVDKRSSSPPTSSISSPLLGRQRRNSFPRGPIAVDQQQRREEDNGPTSPSYVLMNRTRALPKLGGSKVCPRCHNPVAVMDDVPGPMASRWHKKCLACAKCKKRMDSSAKVTQGDQGEWLVHCSDCKDNTPKQKFVRR